jgi:hypothetical protein
LAKKAIEIVPFSQRLEGFYSTYFLVPKKMKDLRTILTLNPFKKKIVIPNYKMEFLANIIHSVNKDEWLASINLMEAYLHVPIHPLHCMWL